MKTIEIYCDNLGRYIDVEGGATLQEIYEQVREEIDFTPICAHVNNKTEGMTYPVFMPKKIEFVDYKHPSGRRLYVRSLSLILVKAVHDIWPTRTLSIKHAVSRGYYCKFKDGETVSAEEVASVKQRMDEIVAAAMPLQRRSKLTADVIVEFEAKGNLHGAELLRSSEEVYTDYHQLDDIVDVTYGELAPDTSYISIYNLIAFQDGMLLLPPDFSGDATKACEPIEQKKMFRAFTDYIKFNRVLGVDDVPSLNRAATDKPRNVGMLITLAETLHEKAIGRIADQIAERYHEGGARVVLLAGPSSSGKTTTTKRLSVELLANLIRPQMISLDNYFVDREHTPKDENGDYDYESLYALDLELFNHDVQELIAGKEVALPTYDFATGRRVYKGNTMKLTEGSILLMEGIHGLNPELTAQIPDYQKFKVYVSALTTITIDDHNWIPTTDNRLLRRIVRDAKYRGTSALDTMRRWPSVRRGEEKWIFPYQENADAMFNSSLLFELAVMKEYAEPVLRQVPHNVPEYAEAYRLLKFLSYFKPIRAEQVPANSLLREFLGGSTFKY